MIFFQSSLIMGLCLTALTASAAPAVVAAIPGAIEPTPRTPAVFSGRGQAIDLAISGVTAQGASLHGDLFQVSGVIVTPLAKDLHLQDNVTLSDASPQKMRVSLDLPEVKRPAEILLRLSLLQNAQAAPSPLGDIRLELFPADVTKELTDLIKPKPDGAVTLIVFGPGQKLRHFLTAQHVRFEDNGSDTPDRFDPARLYFGELATKDQFLQAKDRGAGGRIAVFGPDESLPDGVYSTPSPTGVFIEVTSPFIDNLENDPRAQLALTKVIRLLSNSALILNQSNP